MGVLEFLGNYIHWFCLEMVYNENTYDPLTFCKDGVCGKNLVLKF